MPGDLLDLLIGCGCRKRCCCGKGGGEEVHRDARRNNLFQAQPRTTRPRQVEEETPFVAPPKVRFARLRGPGHSMMAGVGAMRGAAVSAWHPDLASPARVREKGAPPEVRATFREWLPERSYTPFAVGAVAQGRRVYTLWSPWDVAAYGPEFWLALSWWDPVTDATGLVDTLRVLSVAKGGTMPPSAPDEFGAGHVFPERYAAFDQFAPLFVGVQGGTIYLNQHYSHNVGVYDEDGALIGWETTAVGAYVAQASPAGLTGGWVAGEWHSPLRLGELYQGERDTPGDPVLTGGLRTMDQGWSGGAGVMEYGVLSFTQTQVVGAQFWQVGLNPTGVGLSVRGRIDERAVEAFRRSAYVTEYDRAFGPPGEAPTPPAAGTPVASPRAPLVLARAARVEPPPEGQVVRLIVKDASGARVGDRVTVGGGGQRLIGVGEKAVEVRVSTPLDLPADTELPVTRFSTTVLGTGRAYAVRLSADSAPLRLSPTAANGWTGALPRPADPDLNSPDLRRSALRGKVGETLILTFPALPHGWDWADVVLCLTFRTRRQEVAVAVRTPPSTGPFSNTGYYPEGWVRHDTLPATGRHWAQVRLPLVLPLDLAEAWTLTLTADQPLDLSSAVIEAAGAV